ncbi:MAG: hypothetical protein Q7S43_04480 [bacterium]|nr:hypothetical protein [bacterium]
MVEKMGQMKVLVKFFGYQEYKGETGLKAFNIELKELTDAEKRELAELAAVALGVEVEFPAAK